MASAVSAGLVMTAAQLPRTPIGTPSLQAFQAADELLAQHQAAFNVAMGVPQGFGAAPAPATRPTARTHSRATSVLDGMVAMYPAGSLGSVALGGATAAMAPGAGSAFQPLHMQPQHTAGPSAGTSACTSAVPSPYATPSITAVGVSAALGHQRQLSGAPAMQSAGLMSIDTPVTLATAPQTLAPGTPTSFGQLPFQMGGSHHHGHSRHLSLDMANIRLMAAEAASLQGLAPLPGSMSRHSAQMMNALQLETAHTMAANQHQNHHIQQQLQNLQQQLQMQHKGMPLTIRTVPATPLGPAPGGMFAGPPPALLADSLARQQQQQQQILGQGQVPRPMFMHHNSSSVDLGSLASTFSVPPFHPALSGQASPAGLYPTMPGMSHLHMPQAPLLAAAIAGLSGGNGDAMNIDELDYEDDEEDVSDDTGKKSVKRSRAAAKDASEPAGSGSKPKKPKAMYKRFRNSFIFFANERRKQWRREHPEVCKIQNRGFIQDMSKVWNSMTVDEKAPYIKMADEDKLRYEADVKTYGPLPTSGQSSASATPKDASASRQMAELPAKDRSNGNGTSTPVASAPPSAATTPVQAGLLYPSSSPPMLSPLVVRAGMLSQAVTRDPFDTDASQINMAAYQTLLHTAFGQDFSPHGVEFDPSCFIGSDAMAVDGLACADPAMLATRAADSPVPTSDGGAEPFTAGASPAASSSGRTGMNGPPITTLVGTKRKSGSDGQPLTCLPISIKRFRNSFIYFVNERRAELLHNPDGSPTNMEINNREFLRTLSATWRAMSEDDKAPYLQMAEEDKERFARQMREYELEHPGELERGTKHRRRRGSAGSASAEAAARQYEQRMAAAAAECATGGLNIALPAVPLPAITMLSEIAELPGLAHVPSLPAVPEEALPVLQTVLEDAREDAGDM
ncbi:hypothetical protein H4R19_000182 [Coemansia spiralis]|nr:hypothetical protein H4R19_000182 [Coemansia spiralis]